MQIIQNIRDKGAAIVIAVIALSLIGFLLMDARPNGGGRSGSDNPTIGKVNGESIQLKDYDKRVQAAEEQQGGNVTGDARNQIREGVWEQMVSETVLLQDLEKLGIDFTPAELTSMILSDDAPQALKQAFSDPATGEYDIAKASEWWKSVKKMKPSVDKDKKALEQIQMQVVDQARLQGLFTKYRSMFEAAAYYPDWMKKKDSVEASSFADIAFTSIPYNVINDSTIKITDAEISKYVQDHKKQFKQEAGRIISYYSFSSAPNGADSAAVQTTMENLKMTFAADSNEKLFLVKNASAKPFNEDFVYKSKLQGQYKDTIAKLGKGQVFGPYLENNNIELAKMVAVKELPDSARVRHILIKIADLKNGQIANQIRPDSVARKLVDSIAAAIKAGADFNEMVLKYSDDMGSKGTKGEYSFTKDNSLVDSFYRTTFYDPAGTKKVVLGVDQASYAGYHYIEVLGQYKFEPAYKVAYLTREITASDETIQSASQRATQLSGTYHNARALEDYAQKNNIRKVTNPPVKESAYQLGSLRDAKKVIQWAFSAKEGEVSEPLVSGNDNVVAVLEKIIPEGSQDATTARPGVEPILKREKIAAEIMKKIGANPTLETAAAAYPNVAVQNVGADSTITYQFPNIPNIGNEPKVVGAVFNKENLGKVSKPFAGQFGVYVVKVNSVQPKGLTAAQNEERVNNNMKAIGGAFSRWFESLRKMAVIKDTRSKAYN